LLHARAVRACRAGHPGGSPLMNSATLTQMSQQPGLAATHLTPELWAASNRRLVRKALTEYSHELILEPVLQGPAGDGLDRYQVRSDDERTTYSFSARVLALRHWHIAADSIVRERDGQALPLDALQFIIDEIGRASCRGRVCCSTVGGVSVHA